MNPQSIDPSATQRYRQQFDIKYGDGFRQYAKQKGYSDDEINAYIQKKLPSFLQQEAYNDQLAQAQQQQTATAQPKKGGFLSTLLPTGGGVAGTLGGAAAGAALGSVVPVVGTAVGGLIGAVLGGAGGSAIGKVGENAIEGESDLGKGVGEEALFGGLTSLPVGAGFKLARAGAKVATGIGKKAAGDLVQEAGVQTLGKGTVKRGVANAKFDDRAGAALERLGANTTPTPIPGVAQPSGTLVTPTVTSAAEPLSTSLAGRLRTTGDKALLSQYGTISKPFARSTDPGDTIAKLADAGLTKPVDVERVASQITGSNGIVTKATADAVGKAGGVNTSTLRQVFNDAADNYGLVEKDRASLQKVFDSQMNRVSGGAKGSLSPTSNPTDALAMMKALEKRIANLTGKGDNYRLSTPERQDQANVLRLVRDELEDQLYTGAGANKNLKGVLTPKMRDELVALQPGNPQWEKYVDDKIIGAKTVAELRNSVSPFVRGNKIIDEGDANAATFGGRVGNAFAGGGVKSMVGEAVTNLVKNPAARLAGNTLRKASDIVAGVPGGAAASGKVVGQRLIPLTIRQGVGSTVANGISDPTIPDQGTDLTSALAGGGMLSDGSMSLDSGMIDPNSDTSNPFGISLNDVAAQIRQSLATGDTKGYAQLTDLYDRIAATYASGDGKASSTTQKALAQSANGLNTVDTLESLYNAAGGGSNIIQGTIQNAVAGAGLDTNANVYNSQRSAAIASLAKAFGETGTLSDSDIKRYDEMLPKLTDTPAQAQAKFGIIRSRLQNAQSNTAQYGTSATNDDLTSILAGLQ